LPLYRHEYIYYFPRIIPGTYALLIVGYGFISVPKTDV